MEPATRCWSLCLCDANGRVLLVKEDEGERCCWGGEAGGLKALNRQARRCPVRANASLYTVLWLATKRLQLPGLDKPHPFCGRACV